MARNKLNITKLCATIPKTMDIYEFLKQNATKRMYSSELTICGQ